MPCECEEDECDEEGLAEKHCIAYGELEKESMGDTAAPLQKKKYSLLLYQQANLH